MPKGTRIEVIKAPTGEGLKQKIQNIFWGGAKLMKSSADAEGPHDAFCDFCQS